MPPNDNATGMIYKIIDGMTGVSAAYDAKINTNTINTIYTKPTIGSICDNVTADRGSTECMAYYKCDQCENWKQKEEKEERTEMKKTTSVCNPFEIRSVLSNRKKNAFSVVWMDGTTTVVHCQSGDDWDDEKALAMCFTKKALGNKGNFNNKFNDALDNKMKVIHEKKKAIPAKEVCNCDSTCTECKCKEESLVDAVEKLQSTCAKTEDLKNAFGLNKQTATELSKAANKASNSLKETIDVLIGVDVKPVNIYKVFIRISGKSHYDSEHLTIESLRARVHEIAKKLYGKKPYYYRTWMNNGRMIIDFGLHSQFIEVEGITPDEYAEH